MPENNHPLRGKEKVPHTINQSPELNINCEVALRALPPPQVDYCFTASSGGSERYPVKSCKSCLPCGMHLVFHIPPGSNRF